ncbi:MAG: dephospho-CoA kinase [Saprospiraceae bacterium]|nr:dephospho-CoA kinase [Saprospiraceae bacterium]
MKKIGITGGIGSGKTTVCKIFEILNIPIYYADDRSKWLINNNEYIINKLKLNFGDDIYVENILDRKKLAFIVFNNSVKLNELNSIVHPFVQSDFEEWCELQTESKYVLKEAALLFESGSYKCLDLTINVVAPLAERIKRVKERDGSTEIEIINRINKQWSDNEKLKICDLVIYNNNNLSLIHQVLRINKLII